MKFVKTLLLLAISTSLACAESIIPVSCDEIARISINQAKTSEPPFLTDEYPYVYPITLWFKPEAAPKYKEFTNPNRVAVLKPDGTRIEYRPFFLATSTGMIVSNTPYQTCVNYRQILLHLKTKEEAFKAAQMVCPKIKPEAFFVYDYLEKNNQRNSQTR